MLRRTFDPRKPHRYLRYGRMSDPQQNARSPEQQFDTVDSVVKRLGHPWVHVRDYRDNAVSGRYLKKRTGYQQMLSDIRTGVVQVDLILVDTAERLGRVDELTAIRKDLYNRYGVLVLTSDSLFSDPTSPGGRALTMVETMCATEDGRIKAHNVLRGKRDAARLKQWPGGPSPFGLKLQSILIDRDGRQEVDYCILVPDPETDWIIQKLFALAQQTGWGLSRLAQALNSDSAIPAQFKPFYPDTIKYWLTNPIYYGTLRWENYATGIVDDTRVVEKNVEDDVLFVPDFCEPLVARELFEAVVAMFKLRSEAHARSRRKGPTGADKQITVPAPGLALKHLLTGLVRCGLCDRSMRPMSSGCASKEGKRDLYYACPGALVGACDNKLYVPEGWLREAVVANLNARLFPPPQR